MRHLVVLGESEASGSSPPSASAPNEGRVGKREARVTVTVRVRVRVRVGKGEARVTVRDRVRAWCTAYLSQIERGDNIWSGMAWEFGQGEGLGSGLGQFRLVKL